MANVYILHSKKLDKFYIGSCQDLNQRLEKHRNKSFEDSYTTNSEDWELYIDIPNLEYLQARQIELHIKKMKTIGTGLGYHKENYESSDWLIFCLKELANWLPPFARR
eukprot:gene40032-63850_t